MEAEHYSAIFPMKPFVKVDSVPKYKWLRRSDAKADFSQMPQVEKSFLITAFTYPDSVLLAVKAAHQQDAYADSLVIHALAGKDPKIDKWSAVKTDGVMAKEYDLTLEKIKFVGKARVFYYKNEIILVLVTTAATKAGDGQMDFFLNSFHLLP